MKKIILGFVGVMLLSTTSAHATVGGPTYTYNLRVTHGAGATPKEIMYISHSSEGRGCPPLIYLLNTQTKTSSILVGCDEPLYEQNFKSTLDKYPVPLHRIHLPFNLIKAVVTVVREVEDDPGAFMGKKTEFLLELFQQDTKIASIPYSGCYPDQPHVIEGYATPTGSLSVILVSTTGDCFEGGYVREQVFPVSGATLHYNYQLAPRKTSSPAIADAGGANGNLFVIAEKKREAAPVVSTAPGGTETPKATPAHTYQTIIGLLVLLAVFLGVKVWNNSRR